MTRRKEVWGTSEEELFILVLPFSLEVVATTQNRASWRYISLERGSRSKVGNEMREKRWWRNMVKDEVLIYWRPKGVALNAPTKYT